MKVSGRFTFLQYRLPAMITWSSPCWLHGRLARVSAKCGDVICAVKKCSAIRATVQAKEYRVPADRVLSKGKLHECEGVGLDWLEAYNVRGVDVQRAMQQQNDAQDISIPCPVPVECLTCRVMTRSLSVVRSLVPKDEACRVRRTSV